jgi:uncharacterized protein YchJ
MAMDKHLSRHGLVEFNADLEQKNKNGKEVWSFTNERERWWNI